jgi:hypothetical protein
MGSFTLAEVAAKTDVLAGSCSRSASARGAGRYPLAALIERSSELSKDCPIWYGLGDLDALEDRQPPVAIDQVNQATMIDINVVAAYSLRPGRYVRHPPGGLLH